MSSKQINSGNRVPGQRRHIIGRLMGYIKREYKVRFMLVIRTSPAWCGPW